MAIAKIEPKVPFRKKKLEAGDEAKDFIFDTKLTPNERTPVPAYLIYMTYVKWCDLNSLTPKGVSYFFGRFKLYFNSKLIKNVRYYYVSPDSFDLSAPNLKLVQDAYKKQTSEKKVKVQRKTT